MGRRKGTGVLRCAQDDSRNKQHQNKQQQNKQQQEHAKDKDRSRSPSGTTTKKSNGKRQRQEATARGNGKRQRQEQKQQKQTTPEQTTAEQTKLVQLAVEESLRLAEEGVGVVAAKDVANGVADGSETPASVERPLEVVAVESKLLLPVRDVLNDDAERIDVVERGLPGCEQDTDEFVFFRIAHGKDGCRFCGGMRGKKQAPGRPS